MIPPIKPTTSTPFALLRIGTAIVLLLKDVIEFPVLLQLYGPAGFLQWGIAELSLNPVHPRLSWIVDVAHRASIDPDTAIFATFALYFVAALFLLFGRWARAFCMLLWLLHWAFEDSAGFNIYGLDMFLNIALFYCCLGPLDRRFVAFRNAVADPPLVTTTLWLFLFRFHLCVAYFVAGFAKSAGDQWRSGEAIWRAVNMPQFTTGIDWSWLSAAPVLATIASCGTLVIELGYPIFMNVPRTRKVWLLLTVMMHVGIGVTLGLWLFAAIMIVLSVSAYGAGYVEAALGAVRGARPRDARGAQSALRNDGLPDH
jgi:hypothetical protein